MEAHRERLKQPYREIEAKRGGRMREREIETYRDIYGQTYRKRLKQTYR